MASTNLGRVSIVPAGTYNENTPYVRNDIVTYNGSSYINRTPCTGITPSNDGTYWQLVASKGDAYEITESDYDTIVSEIDTMIAGERADAIAAIEAKGEETLDSIPDDYTELSDEVEDLKEAIDSFGREYINLYNGKNNTAQRYINNSNGSLVFNASFSTSDFINIKKYRGKNLNTSMIFSGCFFDDTKTFVANSGFDQSETTDIVIVVPGTATYCRVCFKNANEALVQLGATVSRNNYISGDIYNLSNFYGNRFVGYENLLNISTCLENRYVHPSTGIIATLTDYFASDFIEIGTGNYVTAKNVFDLVVFNEDKTFSRNITRDFDQNPCVALLSGTEKYVRVTAHRTYLNVAMVTKTIGEVTFVPYSGNLKADLIDGEVYKKTKLYVGENSCFKTINDALIAITDNSAKNRYEIIVNPGTYNETITTKDYVDITGENKYKSIINYISDNESDYVNRSTIFATTYTTLKNLTVKTTGTKYPLHCDARYNEPYKVICENCIFKHDGFTTLENAGTAVGIGLYWGQHVSLKKCECYGDGTLGCAGVYCHNAEATNQAQARFRSLEIKNCILGNSTYGLRLQSIETHDLQANECVYIGNKNTGDLPVSLENNGYQSWHILSIENEPEFIQP